VAGVDFEAPVAQSHSADSTEFANLFQAGADAAGEDTPSRRAFSMLAGVTGMLFKPQESNEPFGAMAAFADGRRSAVPSDFRGPLVEVLAEMAARAKHPVLRARLADTCWLLDRKQARSRRRRPWPTWKSSKRLISENSNFASTTAAEP
jgi:hypothetical protein